MSATSCRCVRLSFVRCRLVLILAFTACRYETRVTDDTSSSNSPPHAVIADIDGGAVRIGASGLLALDASDSTDADGDALTWSWSTDCTGSAVANVAAYAMTGITVDCAASVTVTDIHGASDEASVAITVTQIDGYVSTGGGCVPSYDGVRGGTATEPFCAIDDALRAAADVRVEAVRLDNETFAHAPAWVINQDVLIRGGYDRQNGWSRTGTSGITIGIDPAGTAATAFGIIASRGSDVRFEALDIDFAGDCVTDCALVVVNQAHARFDDVGFGQTRRVDVVRAFDAAPGHVYTSLAVNGRVDSETIVEVHEAQIIGPSSAALAIGIGVQGYARADIDSATISFGAVDAIGVYSRDAERTRLSRSTISSAGNGSTRFIGVADGQQIDLLNSGCDDTKPCAGSGLLEIDSSKVIVTNGGRAFGVVAMGSGTLRILGTTTIQIAAPQSIGVLTSAVEIVDITSPTLNVTATTTAADAYAVGYSDNFAGSSALTDTPGSRSVTLTNLAIVVSAVGNDTSGYGINLVGTAQATITDGTAVLQAVDGGGASALRLVGLHTQRLDALTSTGFSLQVSGLISDAGLAYADGLADDGEPIADQHSNNVNFIGNVTVGVVALEPEAIVAGVALAGTQGAQIGPGVHRVSAAGADNVLGLITAATNDVIYSENVVTVEGASAGATVVGAGAVNDGVPGRSALASSGLQILRNRFDVNSNGNLTAGVVIQGSRGEMPVIANNVLQTDPRSRTHGVILVQAGAHVAFNTWRVACPSNRGCNGIYVYYGAGQTLHAYGNVLAVVSAANPLNNASLIARYSSSDAPGVQPTLDVFSTVYGCEAGGCSTTGSVAALVSASGSQLVPDSRTFGPVATGTEFRNNLVAAPVFCADGYHSAPGSPQDNYLVGTPETYGHDIDGNVRGSSPIDVGADAITGLCSP